MTPAESHNWAVVKNTLEQMQAEYRELRTRADKLDARVLQLEQQNAAMRTELLVLRAAKG